MNWLKKIFGKKEKPQEVESPEVIQEVQVPQEREIRGECWWCKQWVYMDEHYAKQQGKLFHKKCYKEAKGQARQLDMV